MERKLIGRVGVDSGQLLIIDPCYIEKHWTKESESKILGIEFWGVGKDNAVKYLQEKGCNVENTENGNGIIHTKSIKQIEFIQQWLIEFLEADFDKNRIVWKVVNNGTYQEVCRLTMNDELSGRLNDIIGCAFQSGFGDGQYEVYATYKDTGFGGMADRRIAKVEINLI